MPAAAKEHHTALLIGGGLAAAAAGYEFLYKPWAAAKALAATPAGLPSLVPTSMLSTPTIVGGGQAAPGGVQGSIVDPRVTPGGDVGYAMWIKNWPQAQAKARLDAIKAAVIQQTGAIAQLQQQSVNPAAAGVAAAQLALQQSDQAAANAAQQKQLNLSQGDQAGAALWASAQAAHEQDSREIRARIATASAPPDNSAAIAAYQGSIAALRKDYATLTGGMTLP